MFKKYFSFLSLFLIAAIGLFLLMHFNKKSILENQGPKTNNLVLIKFGYMPYVSNWPLFLAVEKNYFGEEGLRVELAQFNSGTDAINALSKGDIDSMAVNPLGDLFNLENRTPGLVKIYAMQQSTSKDYNDALLVRVDSDIKTINDLSGKKIGVNPGTAGEAYTKIILDENGINSDQTQIIKLASNLQLQALKTGQIDALVTYEPNISFGVMQNKAKILFPHFYENVLNPFPGIGFTISSKLINEKPSIAKKIVNIMEKSIRYGKVNKKEAYRSSSKYTHLANDVLDQIHNPEQLTYDGINMDQVQVVADLYYKKQLIKEKIDVRKLFYRP